MRRLLALAALAALAACSVDVEGAACADDSHCPAGQRCGHARTCSKAAAACSGEICAATECAGGTLRSCVPDARGICAAFEETTCSAHQACNAPADTCDCVSGGCAAGVGAFCAGSGDLVTCAVEAATGCRYEASSVACDPGKTCGGAPAATCSCPAPGPGVGQGCAASGATSCAAGQVLQACVPVVPGSACSVWAVAERCADTGLVCDPAGTAACACPALTGSPLARFADPGAARRPGLAVNGAPNPPECRYTSIAAALAASQAGDAVKATGFATTPVAFVEGPLTVPPGVALTTTDAPLTTAHYVLQPTGTVGANPFVTLLAGSTLSGFEVRNAAATGVGVATSCALPGDTAAVTVDTVLVTGLGTGAPAPRFSNGLRHAGNCSLTVTGSTFTGADDTGVLVTNAAAASSLTMTGNVVQKNKANVTPYLLGGVDRHGGGLVLFGTHPGTVVFRSNQFLSNDGDQLLVFSPGTLDLSASASCADSNTFACYTTGVGLSSKFGTVNVAHAVWPVQIPAANVDFVVEAGATINGASTQACLNTFTTPCP